jgi:hypothetical protein
MINSFNLNKGREKGFRFSKDSRAPEPLRGIGIPTGSARSGENQREITSSQQQTPPVILF